MTQSFFHLPTINILFPICRTILFRTAEILIAFFHFDKPLAAVKHSVT